MNKFKALFLVVMIVGFASSLFAKTTTVEGKITNATSVKLEEYKGNSLNLVKMVNVDESGNFSITFDQEVKNFFQLSTGGKTKLLLILEPGDELQLELDATEINRPKFLKGSKESELIQKVIHGTWAYDLKIDSLNKVYEKYKGTDKKDSIQKLIMVDYEQIVTAKEKYVVDIFEKNTSSFAFIAFADKMPIESYYQLYKKVDASLYPKYKDNVFVSKLHNQVIAEGSTAVGELAPDFSMLTPEGKELKLSDLRGQVILVDFWASWCGPCRRENPNVVRMYNKYHAMGFDILGVSLDKERSRWLKAIKDDGLVWHHVSDLKGWQNSAAQMYGVKSIPQTILLDKEGRIIAKNLRGAALESKLEELFAK